MEKRGGGKVRKITAFLPMLLSLSLILIPAVLAAPGSTGSSAAKLLAMTRRATDKYHDVSVALADGYVPMSPCDEIDGAAMGMHYVNLGLASDMVVNEVTPEILLFVDTDEGPKLVGVEYFVAADGAFVGPLFDMTLPAGWIWLTPAPTLFEVSMDGPMEPHAAGVMPWHFDLHVWLWHGNPDGMFAEFNPALKC